MNRSSIRRKFGVQSILAAIAISTVAVFPSAPAAGDGAADEPAEVRAIRQSLAYYEQADWDNWVLLFAEDGMLHSVMRDPFQGREALKKRMIEFHHGIGIEEGTMELHIRNIGKVADDVAIVERLDSWVQNGTRREVPAVGVFVFDENGLIKVWREYYDLATLQKAMTP